MKKGGGVSVRDQEKYWGENINEGCYFFVTSPISDWKILFGMRELWFKTHARGLSSTAFIGGQGEGTGV